MSVVYFNNIMSIVMLFHLMSLGSVAIELNLERDPVNVTALLLPFDDNYLLMSISWTRLHFTFCSI